jgi:epoxide hydrolase-like predicted phosphatase
MANAMLCGVILDFGGVFTRVGAREAVLWRCESELHLTKGALSDLLFGSDHWYAHSIGRISAEEYWRQVHAALGGSVPPALARFKYNPFAYEELNRRMVVVGRQLHKRYKTALLSNATLGLESLLARQGLSDLFDVIVNSARVGLRKPDPGIYRITAARLGLEAAECLFVDDKERNTEAARLLGMQTITFRSAAHLTRQLRELAEPRSPTCNLGHAL